LEDNNFTLWSPAIKLSKLKFKLAFTMEYSIAVLVLEYIFESTEYGIRTRGGSEIH